MIPIKDDNPRTSTPFVTWGLIALNVIAFVMEISMGGRSMRAFVWTFGMVPEHVTVLLMRGAPVFYPGVFVPFLTSMFLHGGWLHLGGNMLYLYIFGDNIEDAIGHVQFLLFYLVCGVGAALAHYWVYPNSAIPIVGASGAIAGVLGAYALMFSRARVTTLIPIFFFFQFVELPAYVVLGFWFLIQFFNGFMALGPAGWVGGGVAWWAHIGGFLLGMGLVSILPKRKRPRVMYF